MVTMAARKLDHDEARRLRAAGLKYADIAAATGCNISTVYYACNPHRNTVRVAAKRSQQKRRRYVARLRLAGAPLPCADERWAELEDWFARRRRGEGVAIERVEIRRWTPRTSA